MTASNYPFFKLTLDEKYPRLLITRRPENTLKSQSVYGAFLPQGMARRMLDLLQRLFRLRPCELDIKGDFKTPCQEYFLHRCLAPCVESICSQEDYLETVDIVGLILSNLYELALTKIDEKIQQYSGALAFECAGEWRDKRAIIYEMSLNAKWQINAATMSDVITVKHGKDKEKFQITTLRRGRSVGKLLFQIGTAEVTLGEFIRKFYKFYAPKQIFVPNDFPERKWLEKKLRLAFGLNTTIIARKPERLPPSVNRVNSLLTRSFKYEQGQSIGDKTALLKEIKSLFKSRRLPRRIECFDVAHLGGKEIIASRTVSIGGILRSDEGMVWKFENLSETAALAEAVSERLRLLPQRKHLPDVWLIDGSNPQIAAVKHVIEKFGLKKSTVIGAVKPPNNHNQIRRFVTTEGVGIEFDRRSKGLNFLQSLRDAAHTLANETHRQLHSRVQIFANNNEAVAPRVKYLMVPTRWADVYGFAEDLSPIRSLTQSGRLIVKSERKKSVAAV